MHFTFFILSETLRQRESLKLLVNISNTVGAIYLRSMVF